MGVKCCKLGLTELPLTGLVWWTLLYSCFTENSCLRFSAVVMMQYMDIPFFQIVDLFGATALFLDLAESFVGWYQLVPAVCHCSAKVHPGLLQCIGVCVRSLNGRCKW